MKLLPPPGPERNRALLLTGVAVILVAAYFWFGPGASDSNTVAIVPPSAATAGVKTGVAPGKPGSKGNLVPQALKLAEMEQIPDEPHPTRNIFRFGVPPPPPQPPPPPPPVYTPPPIPTPTPPPPPPPVPLKLNTILAHPTIPGVWIAYLQLETPPNSPPGEIFEAMQGKVVDGKYRVHVVTENSVVVSHLNGDSRRTMQLRGR